MLFRKKTGFTLVELLVVISIIGILAAALTTQVTKVRETARATKCKANLKNLAQASLSYAVQSEYMPCAGSHEFSYLSDSTLKMVYAEQTAWVQWTGDGRWVSSTAQKVMMTPASYYGDNALVSVTNGVLWGYMGRDLSTYICDVHLKAAQAKKLTKVKRSYVMNSFFGYDNGGGGRRRIRLDDVNGAGNAGLRLLFAEMPARTISGYPAVPDKNGVLETKIDKYTASSSIEEKLGFNHMVGKRYVSHVVFADGHVDALLEPRSATDRELKDLVQQLCNGREIEQELRDKMR